MCCAKVQNIQQPVMLKLTFKFGGVSINSQNLCDESFGWLCRINYWSQYKCYEDMLPGWWCKCKWLECSLLMLTTIHSWIAFIDQSSQMLCRLSSVNPITVVYLVEALMTALLVTRGLWLHPSTPTAVNSWMPVAELWRLKKREQYHIAYTRVAPWTYILPPSFCWFQRFYWFVDYEYILYFKLQTCAHRIKL